jgi:hypothetical protein
MDAAPLLQEPVGSANLIVGRFRPISRRARPAFPARWRAARRSADFVRR